MDRQQRRFCGGLHLPGGLLQRGDGVGRQRRGGPVGRLRERHGYPKLTPALRAKVLGLNAARPYAIAPEQIRRHQASDSLARTRAAYAEEPDPSFATYGPRTRREFLRLRHPGG